MCTSPLIRFRSKTAINPDNLFGVSSYFKVKSLRELQSYFKSYSDFKNYFDDNMDYQYIPCRKCNECKMDYALSWSIRCAHELQIRRIGSFITLSIDSAKAGDFVTKKNMDIYCKRCDKGNRYFKYPIDYSLNKGLIFDKIKQIRDKIYYDYKTSIRYFGCGEYGSEEYTERAHYHILIFGFDFPDKVWIGRSKKNVDIYHSPYLQELWHYGIATVQDINFRACMYTAKYCMKKLKFNDDISMQEAYYGREPEFIFMSKGNCQVNRCKHIDDIIKNCKGLNSLKNMNIPYCKDCTKTRGGLGYDWFLKYYRDVVPRGYITIDGMKFPIPKYYIDLLKLTDFEMYDKYKVKLLNSIDDRDEKFPLLRSQEQLDVKAKVLKAKNNLYRRQ